MVVVWTTITTLKIIWRLKQRVEVYSGLGVALCEFEASTVESVLPGDYDVCSLCSLSCALQCFLNTGGRSCSALVHLGFRFSLLIGSSSRLQPRDLPVSAFLGSFWSLGLFRDIFVFTQDLTSYIWLGWNSPK